MKSFFVNGTCKKVQVMEGRSQGERGRVTEINKAKNTVIVDQLNLVGKTRNET